MTIDLTGIATTIIAGIFGVLSIVLPALISSRMKDRAAATVLGDAVRNSLGKMADTGIVLLGGVHPVVSIPGVPLALQAPVQYVLDHAGPEADRFGITPAAIADKVDAQLGLAKRAADAAIAVNAAAPPIPPILNIQPLATGVSR